MRSIPIPNTDDKKSELINQIGNTNIGEKPRTRQRKTIAVASWHEKMFPRKLADVQR